MQHPAKESLGKRKCQLGKRECYWLVWCHLDFPTTNSLFFHCPVTRQLPLSRPVGSFDFSSISIFRHFQRRVKCPGPLGLRHEGHPVKSKFTGTVALLSFTSWKILGTQKTKNKNPKKLSTRFEMLRSPHPCQSDAQSHCPLINQKRLHWQPINWPAFAGASRRPGRLFEKETTTQGTSLVSADFPFYPWSFWNTPSLNQTRVGESFYNPQPFLQTQQWFRPRLKVKDCPLLTIYCHNTLPIFDMGVGQKPGPPWQTSKKNWKLNPDFHSESCAFPPSAQHHAGLLGNALQLHSRP